MCTCVCAYVCSVCVQVPNNTHTCDMHKNTFKSSSQNTQLLRGCQGHLHVEPLSDIHGPVPFYMHITGTRMQDRVQEVGGAQAPGHHMTPA